MRKQRLIQELEHGAFLQPQGLHDRQDALDKAAAGVTVATKSVLAPQHPRPQQALNMVVGRLDAVLARKGPQGRLDGQPTQGLDLARVARDVLKSNFLSGWRSSVR